MRGRVADLIICVKFYRNRLRGFRAVRGENGGLSLTLTVALIQQVYTTVLPVIRPLFAIFSRDYVHVHVRYRLSPVRLSVVCL